MLTKPSCECVCVCKGEGVWGREGGEVVYVCVCMCMCMSFALDKFRIMLLVKFNSVRSPNIPRIPYKRISIERNMLLNATNILNSTTILFFKN